MSRTVQFTSVGAAAMIILAAAHGPSRRATGVAPRDMPRLATIDDRYESYNIEMAEVTGGNFWKPYTSQSIASLTAKAKQASASGPTTFSGHVGQDTTMFQERPPLDLTNPRLRKLAAALGPAYVRVSGSWANSIYFHDADTPAPEKAPNGFDGVLTRAQWRAVLDFAREADARLMTSFAISQGVSATLRPEVDVFSYHHYPTASIRCGMYSPPDTALSEEFLGRTDREYTFYVTGIRDHALPNRPPVWIIGARSCGAG